MTRTVDLTGVSGFGGLHDVDAPCNAGRDNTVRGARSSRMTSREEQLSIPLHLRLTNLVSQEARNQIRPSNKTAIARARVAGICRVISARRWLDTTVRITQRLGDIRISNPVTSRRFRRVSVLGGVRC